MLVKKTFYFFSYCLPFFLIVGSNINLFSIGGRIVSIGFVEFFTIIGIFFFLGKKEFFLFPRTISIPIIFTTICFNLSVIIEAIWSQSNIPASVLVEVIRWNEYVFLFFVLYNLIQTEAQIKKILGITIFSSIVFIIVAINQARTFNFYEARIFGTFLSAADKSGDSISNPNVAGAFLMGVTLFCLCFFALSKRKPTKFFYGILALTAFLLLILTLSRSAFLGFIIGCFFLFSLAKIKWIRGALVLIIPSIFFINFYAENQVLIDRFYETFNSSSVSGGSVTGRFERTYIAISEGMNNFWFGVGFGDFERHFGFFTPDNMYAELFAETGIVGISSFIFLLSFIYIDINRMAKFETTNFFFKAITYSLLATFIGLLVASYAANLLRNPRILGLFWMLMAIAYRYQNIILGKLKKAELG